MRIGTGTGFTDMMFNASINREIMFENALNTIKTRLDNTYDINDVGKEYIDYIVVNSLNAGGVSADELTYEEREQINKLVNSYF